MTYREDPKIAQKYKSKRWQKLREKKLILNPLCERCNKADIKEPAYIVHHKEYITDLNYEDDDVFFNIENLESLCKKCHNKEHFGEKQDYRFDEEGNLIKC
jgi:5-methylcytosine-specific restriction endonuclease McrA